MRPVSSSHMRLQATLGFAGAVALYLWLRAPGLVVAIGLTALLTVLAWFAPERYRVIHTFLDRILQAILTALTWALLAVLFALVFVPGRLFVGRSRFSPTRGRAETFWRACRVSPAPRRFERPF